MEVTELHRWDVTPQEAIAIQNELRERISLRDEWGPVHYVAGIDVNTAGNVARAAIVVLRYPDLQPVDWATYQVPLSFPYIPGLLAFREAPAVLEAVRQLRMGPDLLIFDGQGYAHPRRLGIASHVGLVLDKPSIGCAKSRLCGVYTEPGLQRGEYSFLTDHGETIGVALRTRENTAPVFVSVGHKVSLEAAITWVLRCCTDYRLPETTRWAHKVAGGETPPRAKQERLF